MTGGQVGQKVEEEPGQSGPSLGFLREQANNLRIGKALGSQIDEKALEKADQAVRIATRKLIDRVANDA